MNRKAHPDEKGTERVIEVKTTEVYAIIARLIPMKRELKELPRLARAACGRAIARLIPMKRELKE